MEQTKGVLASTSLLVDIMKKDPDLEDLALKQGMEKDHLQAAKGMAELHHIQKERAEAEYKMPKALQDGTAQNMTAEEKEKLLKPIIKGRLTQEQLVADNEQNCKDAAEKVEEISNDGKNIIMTDRDTQDLWKKNPGSRTDPGYGKMHFDTFRKVDVGCQKMFSPISDTMKNLGTVHGPKHLDMIADEIIRQEGLAKKPQQTEPVVNKNPELMGPGLG